MSGGTGGGGGSGGGGTANKNITAAVEAFSGLKLKNGAKMGGTVSAAMAQQQQLTGGSAQPPEINVLINVPEYPERPSRRGPGMMKAAAAAIIGGGGGGPGGGGASIGMQQPQQQSKGLAAPLADISSSGPNEI